MSETLWDQYIREVSTGEIPSCEKISLSIDRHINDIERSRSDDYPYYFDEKKAATYVNFIRCLRLVEGELAGEFFPLLPWMAFIVASINGWRKKDNPNIKRYYRSLVMVPKKNAKTTLAAALSNASFVLDGEARAQIYFAGSVRDQATICFDFAKLMMMKLRYDSPSIRDSVNILKYNVDHTGNGSFMRVISSDRDSVEGVGGHWINLDELHVLKSDDLYHNLVSSMGARPSPHIFCISTAGPTVHGFCHRFQKVCEDIVRGVKVDERTFAMIYTPDEGDLENWQDEEVWYKVNPSLGHSKKLDFMRNEAQAAINEGASKEIDFKTKHLNVWVSTYSTWIQDHVWTQNSTTWDKSILKRRKCYGGLDLSSKHDLTALVFIFPPSDDDDKWRCIGKYWIPEDSIVKRSKRDGVPYLQWQRDGYISSTPGDFIDLAFIETELRNAWQEYDVEMINFDQHRATDLVIRLQQEGLPFEPFPQFAKYYNEPIEYLYQLVYQGLLDHGNDPVLRWAASNVHLVSDSNDYVRFSKKHSQERIDPMVALAMAAAGYTSTQKDPPRRSVYEDRGILEADDIF